MLNNIINKTGWGVLLCSGVCFIILPPDILVAMGVIGSGLILIGTLLRRASYSNYSKKGNKSFLGNGGGCGGCCGGCGGGDCC